ncbi:hypothetical protein VE00_09933 [Pseudogymnoascus sp. WSF 3629]|nr:hypothetical protein VE00_09933 [Pseudogymnoascus sp. WSF 3629]
MKFSITALALLLTVAIADPAPEVQERAAMLEARACPKNALCSGGKCYTQKRFRDRVRERDDRRSVMSGLQIFPDEDFLLLHATYIFPYAHEQAWVDQGLSRWITDQASPQSQGVSKIHSVQNGLLLDLNCQALFDGQAITVDANDGYKIIYLTQDVLNLDGRTLDLSCRDPQNPDRVPDELFHWHFRQAVLATVKGNGQRIWDMQLEEEDPMGDIMEGPDAAERMEVELFTRLGAGEIDYGAAPEMHSP